MLDTATDGVVTVDERGRILSLNKTAEALFGYDQREVTGELFTLLFAAESHAPALDYLEGLRGGGVASVMNDGREVIGRQGVVPPAGGAHHARRLGDPGRVHVVTLNLNRARTSSASNKVGVSPQCYELATFTCHSHRFRLRYP
eukprot:gene53591-73274_t